MSEDLEITVEEILVARGQDEPAKPENDPTEYLPVMRHHLHDSLWALNMALGHVEAEDLAESYRDSLTAPRSSPLARQLNRAHQTLAAYLGLLDEEDDDEQESVQEDE